MLYLSDIWKCVNAIHHVNKLKEKSIIISLNAEKSFDKIQHPFIIEVLERSGHTKHNKCNFKQDIATIKLNEEELKAIPLKSDTRHGCSLFPYLFNTVFKV